MMVSTAMVVFPVERSPIISSRCPRPIGITASMARMPVCNGAETDCRPIMPGAARSTGFTSVVTIGPLPSSGRPRGSTTRPSIARPQGTSSKRPVERTVCPSRTVSPPLNTTAPTLFSSRFSARPVTPSPKSIISFSRTLRSPSMRATPSPTSMTLPVSSQCASGWNCASVCSMSATIDCIVCLPAFQSKKFNFSTTCPSVFPVAAQSSGPSPDALFQAVTRQ